MKSIEVSGKNVDQAIEIGLFKLEAKREDVKIVVLEDGGLFSKARVKLILSSGEEDKKDSELIVESFLSSLGLNVYSEVEEDDERITINLSGSDIGVLIGKRGDVLDAVQYLLTQMINKGKSGSEHKRVIIDSEGYRSKREETLKLLALRLANKASREGKPVKLEPMSAAERRIIHTALQGRNDIKTFSKGEEPGRFITISPSENAGDKKEKKVAQQMSNKNPNNIKDCRDYND